MSWAIYDRVAETSTSTGTGNFTLAGALTGYRAFDDLLTTGDMFYYLIEAVDGSGVTTGQWETGLGTYSATNTLARTVTHDGSSGSGTAVTFSAGTKRVYLSVTAGSLIHKHVSATRSTNLTAVNAAAAYTTITWDQTYIDTHGFWTVGNPTKLIMPATIPNDAVIQLRASIVLLNLTASQLVEARFYEGGASIGGTTGGTYGQSYPGNTQTVINLTSPTRYASVGDQFEVRVKTGGDTSIDISTDSWFELHVLGSRY
jgi:hypothetical protein